MMRQTIIAITILALLGQGSCQGGLINSILGNAGGNVGGLVGGVLGTVTGTVGGVVGNFVPGLFINDWWAGNVINVNSVTECNRYIAQYGCTADAHNALINAQATAAAAGWNGFASAVAVTAVAQTGGIGPCFRGEYPLAQTQAQTFVNQAAGRKMLSVKV